MTNYPRDEFDRVPEFNTRVGSHHAHGWAQSATSKSTGGKLLWVVLAAVIVLIIGAASFVFAPQLKDSIAGAGGSESTSPTDENESQEPSASESASESSTIDDADVLFDQRIGVYNAASVAGVASAGKEAVTEAGFTNIVTDNWNKPAETSTVYYMSEAERITAEKAAEALNIDDVLQTENVPNRVTVVIGSDDPLELNK
ncbi:MULTISPECIES: LytR C-terminal domain-containing protein [Micrococcaceae]|uniref:LytR C-terminal domain-containing protein n=1 Tax=Micrococcaceae TaxID=1268 RepID=UPI0010363F3B|nr:MULTISPECIES: LytR C-terminal domain-containing protein [Micrococcaceae]TAP26023.1 LytR family transcriptional regulator [Arthrobacter sp. S41]UXN31943.1 LytR C-terminal domain-containing protein [Glutamicibacter sp. M10]